MFSPHPRIALALLTLLTPLAVKGAPLAPANDASAGAAQVQRLLAAMTLDEKIALIHGATEPASSYQGQAGYLPGVPRLGIPALRLADGPPGVLTRQVSGGDFQPRRCAGQRCRDWP